MEKHPTGRPVILVVEDEELVRLLVVQALEEAGFEVRQAAEARAALEVLDGEAAVALMVTDLGLPGMDGRRLACQARAQRPGLKILFMTGYAETRLLQPPLPPGAEVIHKPFNLDALTGKASGLLAA